MEESDFSRPIVCDSGGQQCSESISGMYYLLVFISGMYYLYVVVALSLSCHSSRLNVNAKPLNHGLGQVK